MPRANESHIQNIKAVEKSGVANGDFSLSTVGQILAKKWKKGPKIRHYGFQNGKIFTRV